MYKIVFISNYFNHHQKPVSDAFYKQTRGSYLFIETEEMSIERKNMGWSMVDIPNYVVSYKEFNDNKRKYINIINEASVVIIGSAPDRLVFFRRIRKKIVFRYSERFYKKGCPKWQIPLRFIKNKIRYGTNEYMLCASAYTAADAAITHSFKNKTLKWGYFTETLKYDFDEVFSIKEKNEVPVILWVARLIELKHPEIMIDLAMKLKNDQFKFKIQLIGDGNLRNSIENMINELNLNDCVELLGSMSPTDVRKYMEKANIFVFTSDFNEGWGAVLNEAMNSCCVSIASHAIGSAPYLIENGKNGYIYKNGDIDDLYRLIIKILNNKRKQRKLANNAYNTILNIWDSEVAVERFLNIIPKILNNEKFDLYKSGPCSLAEILSNDWFIKGE